MTERELTLKVLNKVIARSRKRSFSTVMFEYDPSKNYTYEKYAENGKDILIDAMKELGFGDLSEILR